VLDGRTPEVWDKISGLYACGGGRMPGWVRIHANFAHHRDGALRLLGLPPGTRDRRARRSRRRCRAGGPRASSRLPPTPAWWWRRCGVSTSGTRTRSRQPWPRCRCWRSIVSPTARCTRLALPLSPGQHPLQGLRVLDLTRILAGPVAGRTLAAYGADVMLVNSPQLPNIESIAETSRGKLSVHLDLKTAAGRETLRGLVREADVFLQGYRPGGLAALGFGPDDLARLRPGIVCLSLSAYGDSGPWAGRRGFDSLVQTATGFNHAEAAAFGTAEPRALPLQVLDYSAGFLLAFGAQAALLRRAREGGSWQVRVSLARSAQWLRSLGRCSGFQGVPQPDFSDAMETTASGFGELQAVRHAARLSHTPAQWSRPSMPPGTHAPVWPPR
jgi:hypothetical protein